MTERGGRERAAGALRGGRQRVARWWRVDASPRVARWSAALAALRGRPYAGLVTLLAGTAVITGLTLLTRQAFPLTSLGAAYVPLIAMLAYYWGWSLAIAGCALQLAGVYLILLPPMIGFKPLAAEGAVSLLVLAAISVYVLLLVGLARNRRDAAEREVTRFAALNQVGVALGDVAHEDRLLQLIARTACELTGADFAAFTLRPVDASGQPLAPAEGSHFHLAAVVGVTPEQEALFRRVPLGGEGLLAPIFRHGVTVRVDDALAHLPAGHHATRMGDAATLAAGAPAAGAPAADAPAAHESPRDAGRRRALAYAHGEVGAEALSAVGAPRGHPVVRSFLGAPLLDHEGGVRGGLLLGHREPERFTRDDQTLLEALAAQAAVAIENTRLYESARAQAAELNAVFESITDGVMIYDQQGGLLRENPAASATHADLERSPDQAERRAALDALVASATQATPEAPAGWPRERLAMTVRDTHGEAHDYAISASPVQGAQSNDVLTPRVALVWHEVTETHKLLAERQARAEAETRRALLQQVIDEQPGGVYLVQGRDARLALANRAAQAVWGARWAEGQTMADFLASSGAQIVSSDGRALATDDLATIRILRDSATIRHYQEVIRQPDGVALPVLLNAVALDPRMLPPTPDAPSAEDADPEPVALIVLQDMTAIKEAERLKDEFIAIAAHELKTPMAAIKGYADMLTRQATREGAAELAPWQLEALETIDQATSRLVELTEDLLDVARLQADRLQLHIEAHDLIALARRVIKRFQVTSERHSLILDTSDEYIVAALDVRRTEQIIGNLLSNAIKYSPDGGDVTIAIEQDEAAAVATLTVRDQGIGIPADQQALLFNRFARADNARERGIPGAGLGLYLCRELAERQGGRLWFTSEVGRGSVFSLALPLAVEGAQ